MIITLKNLDVLDIIDVKLDISAITEPVSACKVAPAYFSL